MRVIDTFLFCHELDLLEVRLRVLYDYVDAFILQESTTTHGGDKKPLFFNENKERFSWASDKIHHIIMDEPLAKIENDFSLERQQRMSLYKKACEISEKEDIILMSDIDEFPSRECIKSLRDGKIKTPCTFVQDLYYYNIMTPMHKKWLGTSAVTKILMEDIYIMRNNRQKEHNKIGGWHFSYFMSIDEMIYKLKSFCHSKTYGSGDYVKREHIEDRITNKTSLLDKRLKKEDVGVLPQYILDEMSRFPLFMGTA